MRSKGDELRRYSYYTEHGVENAEANMALIRHYGELSKMITDDMSAEIFNVTYLRITARYKGGDFVRQFKALFRSTMRELKLCNISYQAKFRQYDDGILEQTEETDFEP